MPRSALFALLLATLVPLLVPGTAQARLAGVMLDRPAALPAFALTDHLGRPFTERSLPGRWTLLAMGFTNCPDVCPLILSNLEAVRAELSLTIAPDRLPTVVFLAVDPERDRPVLREYLAHFHGEFVGITGEPAQIAALVGGLDAKVTVGPRDGAGNYTVGHSTAVSLIDPDGRLVAKLSPPFEPAEAALFVTNLLRARGRPVQSLAAPPPDPLPDHRHAHGHSGGPAK